MMILLINGPNLGSLGRREPEIYGNMSIAELIKVINKTAEENGVMLKSFQSNHEGKIIDLLEEHHETSDALIINPGALAHTSIALMDAIKAYDKPAVEVHFSNPQEREEFRRHSYSSLACEKTFSGLGIGSYLQAVLYLAENHSTSKKASFKNE